MQKTQNTSMPEIRSFSKTINNESDIDIALFLYLQNNDVNDYELERIFYYLKGIGCKYSKYKIDAFIDFKEKEKMVLTEYQSILVSCLKDYYMILSKTQELHNELSITKSLDVSEFCFNLIKNGYFSINKRNRYDSENLMKIDFFYSFDLFNGRGCCLNISDFCADILNYFGHNATVVINNFSSPFKNRIYSIALKHPVVNPINHASVLIMDDNKPYIYDPTNHAFFQCVNHEIAIDSDYNNSILINKTCSILMCDSDERLDVLKKYYSLDDFNSTYDRNDFLFSFEKQKDIFYSNIDLIEDFYSDIYPSIKALSLNSKKLVKKG